MAPQGLKKSKAQRQNRRQGPIGTAAARRPHVANDRGARQLNARQGNATALHKRPFVEHGRLAAAVPGMAADFTGTHGRSDRRWEASCRRFASGKRQADRGDVGTPSTRDQTAAPQEDPEVGGGSRAERSAAWLYVRDTVPPCLAFWLRQLCPGAARESFRQLDLISARRRSTRAMRTPLGQRADVKLLRTQKPLPPAIVEKGSTRKPAFHDAFQRRCCLAPVDDFYRWRCRIQKILRGRRTEHDPLPTFVSLKCDDGPCPTADLCRRS
jgi:hypothetical protein